MIDILVCQDRLSTVRRSPYVICSIKIRRNLFWYSCSSAMFASMRKASSLAGKISDLLAMSEGSVQYLESTHYNSTTIGLPKKTSCISLVFEDGDCSVRIAINEAKNNACTPFVSIWLDLLVVIDLYRYRTCWLSESGTASLCRNSRCLFASFVMTFIACLYFSMPLSAAYSWQLPALYNSWASRRTPNQ